MAGILDGLKVVSMDLMEAGPAASVWFADWGADVIKVEPLTGELFRGAQRISKRGTWTKLGTTDIQWMIQLLNRNKRGLAANLKTDAGRDLLYRLVKQADVFTTNYELGSLKRLKMDYESLKAVNPGLVYAIMTGYGTVGPEKDRRGYDHAAAWARTGFQYLTGETGCVPPRQRGGVLDRTAASHLVAGVCAALVHRERTGDGQMVEVSLFHSGAWTIALDIEAALVGSPMPRDDRTKAGNPIWNVYRTKDDRWIALGMLQGDVSWPDFCRAISAPELRDDPRFCDMENRFNNCEELIRIIDDVFVSRTAAEWYECLDKSNPNLIFELVQSPTELLNDPQALANDFFVDLHHPAGEMKVVATPVKFRQNPAEVRSPAPEVGQHNEEILLELGYSWEDIAALKEEGAIL